MTTHRWAPTKTPQDAPQRGVSNAEHLSMAGQVTAVVKCCNFHLRNIGRIRPFLTTSACRNVMSMLVTSRIDYCCSLLSGASKQNINRLQRIQNRAARIVSRSRDVHISPVLRDLHWLPCEFRVMFRNLVFVWKCLNGFAPSYLSDMIKVYVPTRSLRSSSDPLKVVINTTRRRIGETSFDQFAPRQWNNLSLSIRSSPNIDIFKRSLKTCLFRLAF